MSDNLSVMTANREQIENLSIKKITMGEPISQSEAREIVRNFPKEIVNANDGRVAKIPVATISKMSRSNAYDITRIIYDLLNLYETSIWGWSEPERVYYGHKTHPNHREYHHYLNKFSDNSGEYYIRFSIPEDNVGNNNIHSATISDISIYKNGDLTQQAPANSRGEEYKPPFIDKKLQEFFASDKNIPNSPMKSQG